ncbi:MAG: hypothetical protein ACLTYN_16330 [Dysosmobacter welbionis]
MLIENRLIAYTLLALLVALVVSFLMTPIVKTFAYKVGASTYPRTPAGCTRLPSPGWGGWPSLSASWSASCCLWRSRPRCAASCWEPLSSWCWAWWTTSWPCRRC